MAAASEEVDRYHEIDATNHGQCRSESQNCGGREKTRGDRAVRRMWASNFRSRYWFRGPVPVTTSNVLSKVLNIPANKNRLSLAEAR